VATSVQQINVGSPQELESTITSYIARGFVVSSRTPDSATLFKKKEFNVIWAVIGFFLCLLPLLVYCIVYATQNDEMVTVMVAQNTAITTATGDGEPTWSEDRQWWWDGGRWRDTLLELPPGAVLAEDRRTWWDGMTWRPVPAKAMPTADSANERRQPGAPLDANPDGEQTSSLPAEE
jgi:hypothetical protein